MRCLYNAVMLLYLLARLPGFLFAGLVRGKYDVLARLREGLHGPSPHALYTARRGPAVWVHACSLGEVLAARPLILGLRERFPERRIVLSTVTRTGYDIARRRLAGVLDGLLYFPFDLPGPVCRSLNAVRPGVVIIIETEIWPNFLRECYRRGVAVVWANGRVSGRAFGRYRLASRWLAPLLSQARLIVARTEEDARRLRLMGASAARVVVAGNLKYDRDPAERQAQQAAARDLDSLLDSLFDPLLDPLSGPKSHGPLIVAGSTTEPEEAIVLAAFDLLRRRRGLERARLLIAPRHPERFGEVAALLAASGLSFARRSNPEPAAEGAEVVLLDTIGELAAAYALADAVFVGGSFSQRGGQSILEPAMHAKVAVVGPHMDNFREVLADFLASKAVIQIEEDEPGAAARHLAGAWARLLERPEEAAEMGRRARMVLERSAGATERTLAALTPIICEPHQRASGSSATL